MICFLFQEKSETALYLVLFVSWIYLLEMNFALIHEARKGKVDKDSRNVCPYQSYTNLAPILTYFCNFLSNKAVREIKAN